jgi:hypothetical protein
VFLRREVRSYSELGCRDFCKEPFSWLTDKREACTFVSFQDGTGCSLPQDCKEEKRFKCA